MLTSPKGCPRCEVKFLLGNEEAKVGLKAYEIPNENRKIFLEQEPVLKNVDIKSAEHVMEGDMHQIRLNFNRSGRKKLAKITRENIGRRMGIVVNERLVAAPRIMAQIPGGVAVISGDFSADEAEKIVRTFSK